MAGEDIKTNSNKVFTSLDLSYQHCDIKHYAYIIPMG
jgi:hypothetical protein